MDWAFYLLHGMMIPEQPYRFETTESENYKPRGNWRDIRIIYKGEIEYQSKKLEELTK